MKRKILLLILVIFLILAIFLSGCCLFENLSADVAITKWEQDYSGGEWSDQAKVYYTITNTGNMEIGFYNIWFAIYCEDGSIWEDFSVIGLSVEVGQAKSRTCWIDIGSNEKVISIEVTNLKLDHFPNQ